MPQASTSFVSARVLSPYARPLHIGAALVLLFALWVTCAGAAGGAIARATPDAIEGAIEGAIAAPLEERVILTHGSEGPAVERVLAPAVPAPAATTPAGGASGGREALLWHRYVPDPIYTSAGLCGATGSIWAGNYLNPPKQVELIPIDGDGTPAWVRGGSEFYVDAARNADVLAALDATSTDSTVTIREWRSGSSAPLWSYPVHPCRPLTGEGWSSGKGVQVSDDGTTIAAVVNRYTASGLRGRLLLFASGSGTPIADVALPDGGASALAITPDGAFVAIYCWPYIHVFDRQANALRWSGSAYSGNDALAISGDGQYIAWGWSNLYLRRWNGSTYAPLWQTSKSGFYVTECALSPNNDRLAVAWYNNATYDENLIEMYDLPGHALQWEFFYGGGSQPAHAPAFDPPREPPRDPTEIVSEMVFSPEGSFLAASSWGSTYPEIHAFAVDSPTPLAAFDTPGSMFDVDICPAGGFVALTACGKHTHAQISGRGADLYSLAIPWVDGVAEEGPLARGAALVRCFPNPARDEVTIVWSHTLGLAGSSGGAGGTVPVAFGSAGTPLAPPEFTIFDCGGRAIARVAGQAGGVAGRTSGGAGSADVRATWNGRDAQGRPVAPGVYLVRASGAEGTGTRITRIR